LKTSIKCQDIVDAKELLHLPDRASIKEIKTHSSSEEWWFERFGNDPLWGKF
jgi:hypothetical protein